MGAEFKPKSVSLDALAQRQLFEIEDAFMSDGRSHFKGRSDEIRKVIGWFHSFIFGGRSLEEFVKAMQSISVINSYQASLLSSAPKAEACAPATLKLGPQHAAPIPSARPGKTSSRGPIATTQLELQPRLAGSPFRITSFRFSFERIAS